MGTSERRRIKSSVNEKIMLLHLHFEHCMYSFMGPDLYLEKAYLSRTQMAPFLSTNIKFVQEAGVAGPGPH
jgi:hypothetical protein